MTAKDVPRPDGVRKLYELMRRVNSSSDPAEVLEEIARGVVEVLGFGVAAISRLEGGDTLVMTNVAGPPEVVAQILNRRTPAEQILDEFRQADRWGILRFVPAGRMSEERLRAAWLLSSRLRSANTLLTGRTSDVLPTDRRQLDGIARLLGYPPRSASQVEEDYLATTRRSRRVFEKLFYG